MKHLIRKQVISLSVDAGQNAFSIQQRARDFYYQQIAPVLEKLFDELSTENEVIQIEKLEIDLGDLGWTNKSFTLDKESIYRILKQSLGNIVSSSGSNVHSRSRVSHITREQNACLQWLFYMKKGVLPWEIKDTEEKWLEYVLQMLATDHVMVEKAKVLIVHDPWFLSRLVREHREEFLVKLAEVITARPQPDIKEKVRVLADQFGDRFAGTRLTNTEIWGHILRQFAAGKPDPGFHEILPIEKKLLPTSDIGAEGELREGIFCQYAGMVLLHPFFRHLFNRLSLLDEGNFKNTASIEKAVVLLNFIATGKSEAKDHALAVPKILCGIHPQAVISEESFLLAEAECEEALSMVEAAIGQWEIIGDTSVEGLRESFLAREGKLLIKESGITFRIESRGIDLLLDHLPWNLSLISFSWLDKLIHVEWR
jgi:hypothetical protein